MSLYTVKRVISSVFNGLENHLLLNPKHSTEWIEADASLQLLDGHSLSLCGVSILKQGSIKVFPFSAGRPEDAQWLPLNSQGLPLYRGIPHKHLPIERRIQALANSTRRILPKWVLTKGRHRCAVLGGDEPDSANYFHFIADTLGDLWFIQRLGISLSTIDLFITPYAGTPWQLDLLSMVGIDHKRILPLHSLNGLIANELIIPIRLRGSRAVPRWLPCAIRDLTGSQLKTGNTKCSSKLYLSRADSFRRTIINEHEIEDLLVVHGFKIIRCSDLSVREQQNLFLSARIVVAPHGAALTNLIWAPPGGKVVELLYSSHHRPCYHQIADLVGWQYSKIQLSDVHFNTGKGSKVAVASPNDIKSIVYAITT